MSVVAVLCVNMVTANMLLSVFFLSDSPARPRIEISGDLKEKESVTITCSALTPCPHSPPKLTWNLQQHSHNKIEENTDRSFTTKIQKTITLTDKHDGYNITCSATYPVKEGVKTAEETKTLSVSYAPKDTSVSISPSALVSAGSWVNLTCSSRAKPPVSRFTWFKTSTDGPMKSQTGDELMVKEPARKTEEKEEDIHYGEIDFSKQRAEASSGSVQDSGQQQDTLYAQVKVSQPENNLTQTADGPEDLYAQVKNK
ncbi:hypothetical protein L3Q82_004600 [Scortum barcoo]|uniref:Uncharacterized protein n=1 Tax=Scortum barcoo TaxID=214431 RepID=A0ACB8VH82_9TELE|nr:hypothetical protein L3Q82_004600 [Scortum barcoo]